MNSKISTDGSNLSKIEVRAIGAFKHEGPVLADRAFEALTCGQQRALHPQQITLRADLSCRHGGGERDGST